MLISGSGADALGSCCLIGDHHGRAACDEPPGCAPRRIPAPRPRCRRLPRADDRGARHDRVRRRRCSEANLAADGSADRLIAQPRGRPPPGQIPAAADVRPPGGRLTSRNSLTSRNEPWSRGNSQQAPCLLISTVVLKVALGCRRVALISGLLAARGRRDRRSREEMRHGLR